MLSFAFDTHKEMDEAETQELCLMLGVGSKAEIKKFLANDAEPHGFYQFFFDVLVEQAIPNAIDIDWRWAPDDLFWQAQRYYADSSIELVDAHEIYDENNNITSWWVKFQVNGKQKEIEVAFERPGDLLEAIKPNIQSRLVDINFFEDRYSWLIVPDTFDDKRFTEITGGKISKQAKPLDVDLVAPLPNKIFFYPAMVSIQRGNETYGVFCVDPQTNQIAGWAGRVLAGQTFQEGIATELKSVFGYDGDFEFGSVSFKDEVPDKKGTLIKRYDVWIKLTGDLDTSAKPLGRQIVLYDFNTSAFVE